MIPQLLAVLFSQALSTPTVSQAVATLLQNSGASSQAIGNSLQILVHLNRVNPDAVQKVVELGIDVAVELGNEINENWSPRHQPISPSLFPAKDWQNYPPGIRDDNLKIYLPSSVKQP
jgi:hypothetical protein